MLRNKLYSILLLSFISSLFVVHNAYAERTYGQIEPPRFKVGRFAVKYEMDRFQARGNFSKEGGGADLVGDFEAYNAYLGAENDLSLKWSASAGVLLGLSRSKVGSDSRRNTDIKGLQFGVNRVLTTPGDQADKMFNLIGDLKFFLSFHENSFGSDDVSIGDGTSWLQAGVWAGTDSFEHFRLWLYGGVNWPFRSYAKNFVFVVRPEFKLWGGRLGVGIEGQTPIIKDSDEDEPTERLRLIDEYNAGSFYYQAINPQFVALNTWFGFEPAPLTEVKIGFGEALSGRSAAQGIRIFATLEVSFSVTRTGYEFPYVKINRGGSKIQKNDGIRRLKNYAKPKRKPKFKKD